MNYKKILIMWVIVSSIEIYSIPPVVKIVTTSIVQDKAMLIPSFMSKMVDGWNISLASKIFSSEPECIMHIMKLAPFAAVIAVPCVYGVQAYNLHNDVIDKGLQYQQILQERFQDESEFANYFGLLDESSKHEWRFDRFNELYPLPDTKLLQLGRMPLITVPLTVATAMACGSPEIFATGIAANYSLFIIAYARAKKEYTGLRNAINQVDKEYFMERKYEQNEKYKQQTASCLEKYQKQKGDMKK